MSSNKSITRNRNDEYHFQEVEVWCRKCRLAHFIIYSQIFNLINDDLHRMFFEKSKSMSLQQHQVRSFSSRSFDKCNFENNDRLIQFRITSCLNANDFICFQNDRIRDFQNLHMLAKTFRVNSRSRCTFLDSRKFFIQFQFADVVKNISSSICLAIDSHRSSRESKKSLFENIDLKKSQKLFVFESLTIDFFLKESLFRRNSRSC